jgi:hypothetical protein
MTLSSCTYVGVAALHLHLVRKGSSVAFDRAGRSCGCRMPQHQLELLGGPGPGLHCRFAVADKLQLVLPFFLLVFGVHNYIVHMFLVIYIG